MHQQGRQRPVRTIIPAEFASSVSPAAIAAFSQQRTRSVSPGLLSAFTRGAQGLSVRRSHALALAAMLAVGAGAAHAAEIQQNDGTGGTSATSSSGTPTAGTSGGNVLFNDTTPQSVSDTGFQTIWVGALSRGGNGGNAYRTGTDGNGTPQYGNVGAAPGNGGDVGLVLNAPLTAYSGVQYGPSTSSGVRGVIAQSVGGNAGAGWYGIAGGTAGEAGLLSNAAVSLYVNWGAPQLNQTVGLAAVTHGGFGTATTENQFNGGAGGNAGPAYVTANLGGDVLIDQSNAPSSLASGFARAFPNPNPVAGPFTGAGDFVGAGIVASSWAGNGGMGYDHSTGGAGGGASTAQVRLFDAGVNIISSGTQSARMTPGVLAESVGGTGGNGGLQQNHSSGGVGGASGPVNVVFSATTPPPAGTVRTISTQALQSPAIAALAFGGAGGNGTDYSAFNVAGAGGDGGAGGAGGVIGVHMGTPALPTAVKVSTMLDQSPAIYAVSNGGNGGTGGEYGGGATGNGGAGGNGGNGGKVTIVTYGDVTTAGPTNSPGIWALSQGGNGGDGGEAGSGVTDGGTGGNGGSTGTVNVVANSGTISTAGTASPGIFVQSISGTAGNGGNGDSVLFGAAGGAGAGGATGLISVGNLAAIVTTGDQSQGMLIQNQSGSGGSVGTGGSLLYSNGSNGGSAGTVGDTQVTHGGSIQTSGAQSAGIEVQSLSGGGGTGGISNGSVIQIGGDGGTGQNAGTIEATLSGSIQTFGDGSHGVMLEAIGGGGGSATDLPPGFITGIGGSGGVSGNGGQITSTATGLIGTQGDGAIGLLVQSIGGGGGSAGGGSGIVAIGGNGASGGSGGTLTVTNSGTITTQGIQSYGIAGQSVGGGGGVGGGTTLTIVSVGGSGSITGNGGTVTFNGNGGNVTTTGEQAYGIVMQSVGGGGGIGGDADVTSATNNGTGLIAVGGAGTSGGSGGSVGFTAGGSVTTKGDNAHAIIAQSIGGGGGIAGNATSYSAFAGMAIGAQGGSGGASGTVTVSTSPGTQITTYGTSAAGILAQSAGGGGGAAGGGYSFTVGAGFAASLATGGKGGSGGSGNTASVTLSGATVITGLDTASAVDPTTLPDETVLDPLPIDAAGVVAQSIGGGGGNGGSASAKAVAVDVPNPFVPASGAISLSGAFAVGGSAGTAGNGGTATINLSNGSDILTYGNGGFGLLAQSVGGGGGRGGDSSASSVSFGLKDVASLAGFKNYNLDLTYSNGGNGGGGGYGGPVNITLGGVDFVQDGSSLPASSVETLGDYAFAVAAQSIGGGGGDAGFGAGSTQNFTSSSSALTMALTVGAQGGTGGAGGTVSVTQYANAPIYTFGDTSYGIFAESVGGGGGSSTGGSYQAGLPSINNVQKILDGQSVPYVGGLIGKATIKAGTNGGTGGNGGRVNVDVNGFVSTGGEAATAVVAQSVGGGGGVAGSAGSAASSDNPYLPNSPIDGLRDAKKLADNALAGYLINLYNLIGNDGSKWSALTAYLPSFNFNLSLGASGGTGGYGGAVDVTLDDATIATAGDHAKGVVAQSVGGGGG
ncbi:MAG TPA: hypothetical protein VIQ29_10595, partial [Ancylobacter sp.]